jgi:chemotaxis protein MotB
MRRAGFLSMVLALALAIVTGGCVAQQQFDEVKAQNRIQQQRITDLEGELGACQLQLAQSVKQLETLQGRNSAEVGGKDAEIAALEKDIEAKKALIAKMQAQLLRSGAALPMELSVKLQDFANRYKMVTFDAGSGMLKFESDLLFELGSDTVAPEAVASVKALCDIMNSKEAQEFDVVIAGHTDDVPIKKPATREKHPTNWHLSVHRSIAVLNIMTANNMDPTRVSVRGFGEYRPIAENKPNKKGNPANRRVELYIVPSGT